MKIGIAGPIATESIAGFLRDDPLRLPIGYEGAPFFSSLIAALLERGHEVCAYTTSVMWPTAVALPRVTARGERFTIHYVQSRRHSFRFNGARLGRMADFYRLERENLVRAIVEDRPDIVHAHWTYEFALAAMASKHPYVVTCHDSPAKVLKYMPNLYRFCRYLMARVVLRKATSLTAVSPYLKNEVQSLASVPIDIIPNPLPKSVFAVSTPKDVNFDPLAPRLAMVTMGWGELKNPKTGMRAFARIRDQVPGATLHLFGADFGPGEAAQRWAAAESVETAVTFHGRLSHERLLENLRRIDILLHPSYEEGASLSVAEAMSLGVPVVAGRDSGGVPWLLDDGAAGVLTDVHLPEMMAEAVFALLGDVARYRGIARAAIARSRELFSPDAVATLYLEKYRRAIAARGLAVSH
jgi:L-malate glycosyltransferase